MRPDPGEGEKRTNEIGTILPLLETVPDIARRTVTTDALLTQRALATYLLGRGAHYLFTVKGNQPNMLDDIRLTLDELIAQRPPDFTDESPKPEHGRRERRSIWVSSALNDYLDFPGVGQVFAIGRQTVEVKSAKRRSETAYGVTSLTPHDASPQRLLTLNRGHWTIEATHHILRLVLRRGPQPYPHRARSREHDPATPLRHRPHQGARARCRRDHASLGQESATGSRLPQDDRQRLPSRSTRLSAPCGSLPRASPPALGTRGTTAHARRPRQWTVMPKGSAIRPPKHGDIRHRAPERAAMKATRRVLDARDSTPTIRTNLP